MSYRLFLDDMRRPSKVYPETFDIAWTQAYNYEEFVKLITARGLPEFVSFDHDLAPEHYAPLLQGQQYKEKTGLDCARWLIAYCKSRQLALPQYKIHSLNATGKQAISDILYHYAV